MMDEVNATVRMIKDENGIGIEIVVEGEEGPAVVYQPFNRNQLMLELASETEVSLPQVKALLRRADAVLRAAGHTWAVGGEKAAQ
jgi:hypothetical protein